MLFATVLFLVAIAQRFKVRSVRIATTTVAFGLAAFTTVAVLTLPRIWPACLPVLSQRQMSGTDYRREANST